ncbi:MAG: DUF1998 domain-containing protein, partial [Nitrospirae bacterium]|nr:DUF1998 domain-containing protein [Nitrospirota bacterium]
GGTGYLSRTASEFHLVARRALAHLDHKDCQNACYRCLKSYQNQRYHHLLEWPRIIPDLEVLAESAPQVQILDKRDSDSYKAWLEAYNQGFGSPLELAFGKLFAQYGFSPQKQFPIVLKEGGIPVSIADFAVPLTSNTF